jgi:hypothetical protein
LFTFQQTNVERVNFGIVANFHGQPLSKVKCINGYDNDFVRFLFNDGRNLFDRVAFALPLTIKDEISSRQRAQCVSARIELLSHGLYFHVRASR